jgi:phosphatidylglycerophosphatase A
MPSTSIASQRKTKSAKSMSERTEQTGSDGEKVATGMRKPRFSLFIATAGGLGYLPKAPGTWGSLGGLFLAIVPMWTLRFILTPVIQNNGSASVTNAVFGDPFHDPIFLLQLAVTIFVGAIGVWTANRAAKFWGLKDPQRVVIDEVSGQLLTLLLGAPLPFWSRIPVPFVDRPRALVLMHSPLNWKYLLLGFILFRVFDIWKPFPARQAESLPGGWGIMADDWIAGVYAALGLWLARAAGL